MLYNLPFDVLALSPIAIHGMRLAAQQVLVPLCMRWINRDTVLCCLLPYLERGWHCDTHAGANVPRAVDPALAPTSAPPGARLQSRRGDVNCVVRSIARRSLIDGALVDILTNAGPSPTSLLLLAGSQCVTHPPGYGYLVFADVRLVYVLSDQWKLHSIPGPPRLV